MQYNGPTNQRDFPVHNWYNKKDYQLNFFYIKDAVSRIWTCFIPGAIEFAKNTPTKDDPTRTVYNLIEDIEGQMTRFTSNTDLSTICEKVYKYEVLWMQIFRRMAQLKLQRGIEFVTLAELRMLEGPDKAPYMVTPKFIGLNCIYDLPGTIRAAFYDKGASICSFPLDVLQPGTMVFSASEVLVLAAKGFSYNTLCKIIDTKSSLGTWINVDDVLRIC